MRIAFFDFIDWDYSVDSAYQRPLGGSQSALCYLAEALAALGHQVLLINNVAQPALVRGVRCLPLRQATTEVLRRLDVAVVLNTVKKGARLREHLDESTKLVLWIQHAHDQPASRTLANPEVCNAYDAFVLVSRWQRDCFIDHFDLSAQRCMILRNAVGPRFAEMFADTDRLPPNKLWPPKLIYTSTPFRGLDLLLAAFPAIRAALPEATLDVFSSLQVYNATAEEDATRCGELYEFCRSTDGVTYHGSIPQPELAEHMKQATLLAYPNHFAETSCIVVLEALAAGCYVVTSELGALPETGQHFATLVPVGEDWHAYLQSFTEQVVQTLARIQDDPAAAEQALLTQAMQVCQSNNWRLRAEQWATWLEASMEVDPSGISTQARR